MRSRAPSFLLFALAACGGTGAPADASPAGDAASIDGGVTSDSAIPFDGGPPLRVLFVGNSYTYVNDLPAVVSALGDATPGGAVEVESITLGGAILWDHWVSTGARERIEMGGLDAVVLQGQSLETIQGKGGFPVTAALFSGALADAGARGVWFATWARRAGDPLYPGLVDPEHMTYRIEAAYAEAAAVSPGDVVARVGAAWQTSLAELPAVALHDADGSHPTAAGTLLAACEILRALTGQAPRVPDPPPLGVPLETARALCAITPPVTCIEEKGVCGGACVELQFNVDHCGACDVACGPDDPCRFGVCGCDAGYTGCDRSCVDVLTDAAHCGDCDTTCTIGAVCESGSCSCPGASFQAPAIEDLAALRPACATWDAAGSLDCNAAAHEYCAAFDCHDSGFGPPAGHAPSVEGVMCVPGDVRETTYTALSTFVPACDGVGERLGQSCSTAISRYCASTGAVSGFGPVAGIGDDVTVTCVSSGTLVHTTLDAVSAHASRCTPDPVTCSVASWNFCASLGYAGGFGPVEVSGEDLDVVCFAG